MSFANDCVMNNSINDNKVNAKKAAANPMLHIKKLIKNILQKKSSNSKKSSCYQKNPQPNYLLEDEIEDNIANEILENEIFEDIDSCEQFAAVRVFGGSGEAHILPVMRGQRFIPVNFARTDAGTFFWTSVSHQDSDVISIGDENAICGHQDAEIQTPCSGDRWAQA